MTNAKVEVSLIIEKVTEHTTSRTVNIIPNTKENDWYGMDETYYNTSYIVKFTNGHSETYKKIADIKITQ